MDNFCFYFFNNFSAILLCIINMLNVLNMVDSFQIFIPLAGIQNSHLISLLAGNGKIPNNEIW